MKLFVIGATGRTGQELVRQALERGYAVTALVRSTGKMTLTHDRLRVIEGNPMREGPLTDALSGHDAVVTALGPPDSKKPSTLLYDAARATVCAMKRENMKRIVVLSAAAHFPGFLNGIVRRILHNHMQDSMAMETFVRDSGLDWTIVRPPRLTQDNDPAYRSQVGAPPIRGFIISRKAVAAFMLDVLDRNAHLHQIVGIAK